MLKNVAFWSEAEKKYVAYFRIWTQQGYSGFRSIGRATSDDFIHWSETTAMTFGDTPMQHLYTNQTHPYFRAPQIYVAIAARFMPNRQVVDEKSAQQLGVNPKYYKDCSDAILMTSRGGSQYDRTLYGKLYSARDRFEKLGFAHQLPGIKCRANQSNGDVHLCESGLCPAHRTPTSLQPPLRWIYFRARFLYGR